MVDQGLMLVAAQWLESYLIVISPLGLVVLYLVYKVSSNE